MELCYNRDNSICNTKKVNKKKKFNKKVMEQKKVCQINKHAHDPESKKRKIKKIESLREGKRFQLRICSSSSSECIEEFTPSKSECISPSKSINDNSNSDHNFHLQDSKTSSFDIRRFFQEYNTIQCQDREVLDGSLIEELSGMRTSDIQEEVENYELLADGSDFVAVSDTDLEKPLDAEEEHQQSSNANIADEYEDITNIEELTSCTCPEVLDSAKSVPKYSKVKYYDFDDYKLVILSGEIKLPFYGIASVSVLYGKIDILGVVMDKASQKKNIYSPRGTSLLYIKNVNQTQDQYGVAACLRRFQCVDVSKLNLTFPTSVITCQILCEPFMTYIEKHISQQILPKKEEHLPQCIFEPKLRDSKGVGNVIETTEDWNTQIDNITCNTKMLICGGKGVGKSTFLRYCINRLLMSYDKVCVIDLDPGQSEFTLPGCLSLVTVSQPLLGPNYTHLQKTDCCILSDINVGNDPRKYLRNIKQLVSKLKLHKPVPILINYMGFNRGVGLNIVSSVVAIIGPTDILMIQSEKSHNNFKKILSKYVILNEAKLFSGKVDIPSYNLITIKSLTDGNDGWSLVPRQMREMCFLAYFGKLMTTSVTSILSPKIPVYETVLSEISFIDTNGKCISPMAANANVVTLCSSLHDQDFLVYGWGIVRGIDLEKDVLVLLTPLDSYSLEKVDHLVVGNVTLPPSVIMTTDNVFGLVPYIHEGELQGSVTKRSYLPPSKR